MFTPILRLAREETQKAVKGNPPADQSLSDCGPRQRGRGFREGDTEWEGAHSIKKCWPHSVKVEQSRKISDFLSCSNGKMNFICLHWPTLPDLDRRKRLRSSWTLLLFYFYGPSKLKFAKSLRTEHHTAIFKSFGNISLKFKNLDR